MAYVQVPCSRCGEIMPKNQLVPLVSEVRTGRISAAVTTGTYASGRPRYSVKSGQKTFETREEWLCAACENERLGRIATARRARLIKWSVVALAVVVLVAFLQLAPGPAPGTSPAQSERPTVVAPEKRPVEPASPAPLATNPEESRVSPNNPLDPNSGADHFFVVDGENLLDNVAFRAAAREALDTGEAVLWGDRSGGEVSVGPLDETSGRSCRTLAHTVAGRRSGDLVMCRNADGRWSPQ